MKSHTTEADARILIDDLLREALWNPADKSEVLTEVYIQQAKAIAGVQQAFEDPVPEYISKGQSEQDSKTISGRADYVLRDCKGRALAVVEAKKNAINPYVAKHQALPYAKKLGAPFIFLTNGELIYFRDYLNDDARIVDSFFSRRDMERLVESRNNRKPLAIVEIPEFYIRQGETRSLRPYQQEAMQALDHAFELGKRRFLIELPTGTGKTDLSVLYIKRLIEAGWAERILFLVDREHLAKQALEAIQDLLGGQYGSYWLKPGVVRQEKQITVCLLQTMISRTHEYTSGYFDVVIMDESHRSIYGVWQASLTRFDALHIGLTATPANYIDRNTYEFYHCKAGQPDFSYRIQDAFEAGYLTPYKFATGITEIISEGVDVDEEHYDPAKFERQWTNDKTNRLMMEEFDRLTWESFEELAPGQKVGPGKTVVFAITKHHAARLAQYLNELHPEHKGNYAVVITSDVSDPDALIRQFKKETYPMVAVSVGMLDTGFDFREILHLVMCRRVMSPILYQQMRGRGTRIAPHIQKKKFVIYDFFNNHKRWNDSDTDVFTGGGMGGTAPGGSGGQPEPAELIELGVDDEWLEAVTYVEVGPEGERIDKKEYQTNWQKTIQEMSQEDPLIDKVKNGQPLSEQEEKKLSEKLNSPRHYFNEENLRRAYRNPAGNLIDFIKTALGLFKIKSRDEKIEEMFRAWLVSRSLAPEQAEYLSLLKNRGIATGRVRLDDLFKPPLSILNAAGIGVELFGEQGLQEILEDLNSNVFNKVA